MDTVRQCIAGACESLEGAGDSKFDLVSIGITNQRETTVAWDKETGMHTHYNLKLLLGDVNSLLNGVVV